MKKVALMFGALLMFGMTQGFFAQELEAVEEEVVKPVADARIKAALDRQKIDYEIDDDGDFRVIFTTDDDGDRTQLVFVNSNVEKYGEKLEIREIWSLGYKNDGAVPPALVKKAAKMSRDYIVGAWEVIGDNRLALVAKVPANLDDDTLLGTIGSVGRKADAFEKDTQGTDDL
ncbi:MAG: hypothetical protein J5654_09120 [Victivallales bacterium]|nr:hypothetical protein [Victivallales bacterium]